MTGATVDGEARPRVLLVDDDASTGRFVALALDGLPLQLLTAETPAQAQALLAARRPVVVLADLTRPDGRGAQALAHLAVAVGPGAAPPWRVAFRAAAMVPAAAPPPAVDEWLHKPLSAQALRGCVLRALGRAAAGATGADAASAAPRTVAAPACDAPCASGPTLDVAAFTRTAVARHFGGSAALFAQYAGACARQFPADVAQGDAALAAADADTLRRLVHSLKTVLTTLGDDAGSARARALELSLAAGTAPGLLCADWALLRPRLQAIASALGPASAAAPQTGPHPRS